MLIFVCREEKYASVFLCQLRLVSLPRLLSSRFYGVWHSKHIVPMLLKKDLGGREYCRQILFSLGV